MKLFLEFLNAFTNILPALMKYITNQDKCTLQRNLGCAFPVMSAFTYVLASVSTSYRM